MNTTTSITLKKDDILYKMQQINEMIMVEMDLEIGGYGANLKHWSTKTKPINLDSEALKALFDYYAKLCFEVEG